MANKVMKMLGFVVALTIGALASPALTKDLPSPVGPVILTVKGAIGTTNMEGAAQFDLAMLQALPAVTFSTTTGWTEGVHAFTGVQLKDFVAAMDSQGSLLKMTAINDYMVEVPVADAVEGGPILAYLMDGQEMSIREKGPLWLIYPYDTKPEYQSEVIYARSIWQLDRIEISP